jgi:hypothetical protein
MPQLPDALAHGPPEARALFEKVAASRGFVSNLLRALGHDARYGTGQVAAAPNQGV